MTISIRCLLQEAEEILQNMALEELAEDVAETENGKILVLGGWWVEIPSLEITLRAGISCYQETEPPGYFPEAPIRVIAETGKEESKTEILVFEGEAAFCVYTGRNGTGRNRTTSLFSLRTGGRSLPSQKGFDE